MGKDSRTLVNQPTTVIVKPSEVKTPIQVNIQPPESIKLADAINSLSKTIKISSFDLNAAILAASSAVPLDGTEIIPVSKGGVKSFTILDFVNFIKGLIPETHGYIITNDSSPFSDVPIMDMERSDRAVSHFEEIGISVRVTAIVAATLTFDIIWTDENGNPASLNIPCAVTINANGLYTLPTSSILSSPYPQGGPGGPSVRINMTGTSATIDLLVQQTSYDLG